MFQGIFTVSLQNYFFFTEHPRLLYKVVVRCFNGFYGELLTFFPYFLVGQVEGKRISTKISGGLLISYLLPVFLVSSLVWNLIFSLCLCGWGKQQKAFSIIQSSPKFLHLPVQVFYNSLTLRDVEVCSLSWNACICLPEVHSSRSIHRILLDCSYLT